MFLYRSELIADPRVPVDQTSGPTAWPSPTIVGVRNSTRPSNNAPSARGPCAAAGQHQSIAFLDHERPLRPGSRIATAPVDLHDEEYAVGLMLDRLDGHADRRAVRRRH